MFFSKWFKTKPLKPLNQFHLKVQSAIAVLNRLRNLRDFNVLYSSDYKLINITTINKNIIECNLALTKALSCLKDNRELSKYNVSSELYYVNIHEFLLDNRRRYIDLHLHLPQFCDTAVEFLNTYMEKEQQPEQSSELVRTLYLSQFLVNDLLTLIEGFKDV
jgi:hypothetical protein